MELKSRTWMDAWSDADFDEYSLAWHAATAISDDSGARSREWLRLVLDAEQAHRQWAKDVLADMQRRGALESWKQAPIVPVITNKRGKSLTTRGAAKRRTAGGQAVAYVQESLFDMSRDELQQQARAGWKVSATHRAKAQLAERLLELIDQAGGTCTPREAAAHLKVDLTEWCAA